MLGALVVVLCAADANVDSSGDAELTPHEVRVAPVGLLTLSELADEDRRLSEPPSPVHSIVSLALGSAIALGFGIGEWAVLSGRPPASGRPGNAPPILLEAIVLGLFGSSGAVMALIGSSFLPWVIGTRRAYAERQSQVRARIAILRDAPPAPAPAENLSELRKLEDERPGYLLPVCITAAGTVPLVVGLGSYLSLSPNPNAGSYALAVTLMVVGLAAEGLGLGLLLSTIRARADLDDQIRALEPPPQLPPAGATLPPVPNHFALGGRF
jgi:hypothetical protein